MPGAIYADLEKIRCLESLWLQVEEYLKGLREVHDQLGFVSGPVTCDGAEKKQENLVRLVMETERLQAQYDFPILCDPMLVDDEIRRRICEEEISYDEWMRFWLRVVGSGYVTDLYLLEGWERSGGVRMELEVAEDYGLTIVRL